MSNKPLECIEMHTSAGASATVSLFGGHLISWKPQTDAQEQLYLSEIANMDGSKAIRGGVPVLFPHFGAQSNSPNHGFARLSKWHQISRTTTIHKDVLTLALSADEETKQIWPFEFNLCLTVSLSDSNIHLELSVENTSENTFSFSGGLHTYFSTSDIVKTQLLGLKNCQYIEQDQQHEELQRIVEIRSETDRVYLTGERKLDLISPERRVVVESSGFTETVVWNPWSDGSEKMTDMKNDDYLTMLCVEAVIATEKICLHPKQVWSGSQSLKYESGSGQFVDKETS